MWSWRKWRALAAHRTPLPLMVKHAYGRCPARTQLSTRPLVTGHIWRRNTPQSPQKMGEGDYGRIPKVFCPLSYFGEEGRPSHDFSYFFHIFFTIGFGQQLFKVLRKEDGIHCSRLPATLTHDKLQSKRIIFLNGCAALLFNVWWVLSS